MEALKILNHIKKNNGLCPSGVEIFKSNQGDIKRIAKIAKKWVEIFIEHENAEDVTQYFMPAEIKALNAEGLFFSQKVKLEGSKLPDVIILIGKCDFDISAGGFDVSTIYALGDSRGSITASEYSILNINAHHRSKVSVTTNENAKANIYNYGATVETELPVQHKVWESNEIFNYKW